MMVLIRRSVVVSSTGAMAHLSKCRMLYLFVTRMYRFLVFPAEILVMFWSTQGPPMKSKKLFLTLEIVEIEIVAATVGEILS